MHWLTKTAAVTGLTASALIGSAVAANAQDDPACDWLGWRHPACAGGYYDDPLPKSPAGAGLNPFPGQMVPNIGGGLSLPGTPGAI